jgi:hypothetical protein
MAPVPSLAVVGDEGLSWWQQLIAIVKSMSFDRSIDRVAQ